MNLKYVEEQADLIFDDMVCSRRYIHKYPGLGYQETGTQKYILDYLEGEGISCKKIADTGVVAVIEGSRPGKTVALRSDMDALPMIEQSGRDYRSVNDGIMHACGHDAHTAINLGCARFFNRNRDKFAGTVKLFYQPAEESIGGAKRMIDEGCMLNPDVDYVLGLHVMGYMPYNQIEVKSGPLNAAVDTAHIRFVGKGGHGAYPETAIDPIVMAAQFITAAQTIISRNISPLDQGVFTVGKITSGTAQNIIPDDAKLLATIRSSSPEVRTVLWRRIRELAEGIAVAMGGRAELEIEEGYPALVVNSQIIDIVRNEAIAYLGRENVLEKSAMSMGAEDFSYFCNVATSAFYNLGCRVEGRESYGLHTRDFDIDERCLKTGLIVQVMSALRLIET